MASQNLYHRRLVAETSGKACWICYKPSSTVLITPESDDWFHICPGHLTDRKFAIPKDEEDLAKKKREADLEKEIEAIKKEYEEKQRKKADKRKDKDKGKGKRTFDCAICMQDLEVPIVEAGEAAGDVAGGFVLARRLYMVTPCRHIFHTPCLEGWMKYRLQCPNCREGLPPL